MYVHQSPKCQKDLWMVHEVDVPEDESWGCQKKRSSRRVKSGMSLFSTLWDIFSYFLIEVKLRSPLGRNRDGMCVPSLLRRSHMAQHLLHKGFQVWPWQKGVLCSAKGAADQLEPWESVTMETKCSRGEFIVLGTAGCHSRTAALGVQRCPPETSPCVLRGMWALPWVRYLCLQSMGSSDALCRLLQPI